jgi:uncharacterized protein YecE (DUF72 family)
MRLFAGTSGFSYTEWRGSFYPEKLPASQMLASYSSRLPTVELNNTFYRMPRPALIEGWARGVPEGFTFAPKAPRRITHSQKLEGSADDVAYFLETVGGLGNKLGPLLFQLPPFLKKDVPRLSAFLELLPAGTRAALEFRHESWFDDEVYAALAAREVALCAAEVDPGDGTGAPLLRTAPYTYVRLRRAEYDAAALDGFLTRLAGLGVDEAFVYFKHEVLGPSYAVELLKRGPADPSQRGGVAQ